MVCCCVSLAVLSRREHLMRPVWRQWTLTPTPWEKCHHFRGLRFSFVCLKKRHTKKGKGSPRAATPLWIFFLSRLDYYPQYIAKKERRTLNRESPETRVKCEKQHLHWRFQWSTYTVTRRYARWWVLKKIGDFFLNHLHRDAAAPSSLLFWIRRQLTLPPACWWHPRASDWDARMIRIQPLFICRYIYFKSRPPPKGGWAREKV